MPLDEFYRWIAYFQIVNEQEKEANKRAERGG